MSANLSQDATVQRVAAVHAVRVALCSVMGDMGGIADRLRDMEEGALVSTESEAWEEIAGWANQAQEQMQQIAQLAINRAEQQ